MKYNHSKPNGIPDPFEKTDANVKEKLPKGSEVTQLAQFGHSFWSQIGRLDVRLADGSPKSYLLKITPNDRGKGMSEGEFASMSELHAVNPDFVPRPVAWGSYRDIPNTHFFLAEFLELIDKLPEPEDLARSLAGFHKSAEAASPSGKYGFHSTTWSGVVPRENEWCDTWEEYFTRELTHRLELEKDRHPLDVEMERLSKQLLQKVVPRLLRPLTDHGSIRPVLLHGDLWDKNIAINAKTRKPVIFDAGCIYGHNEYEIGLWRSTRYNFSSEHINAYFRHFPPAEPREDFADRGLLYSISMDLCASYVHQCGLPYQNLAKSTMRYLIGKYSGGYEEWLQKA
ncbi:Fructosamine kinase-domain-containing protein [Biscogniauxia marginata]|nr:Fructosamine kinase-domain-containing protein [Biscogniauxia marginata]